MINTYPATKNIADVIKMMSPLQDFSTWGSAHIVGNIIDVITDKMSKLHEKCWK